MKIVSIRYDRDCQEDKSVVTVEMTLEEIYILIENIGNETKKT